MLNRPTEADIRRAIAFIDKRLYDLPPGSSSAAVNLLAQKEALLWAVGDVENRWLDGTILRRGK